MMSKILSTLLNERPVETGIFVSVLMMIAVHIFQYGFDLAPCELCYYQRYPYYAVIGIGIAGLLLARGAKGKSVVIFTGLLAIFLLFFLIDAGIAAFHVGVEQKWWQGPTTCSATSFSGNVEDQLKQIMQAPLVRCDEVAWSLFGISMAGYNVLIALGMSIFTGLALKQRMAA